MIGAAGTTHDGQARHGTDGGQRLTAETEGQNCGEIVVLQLGGSVALYRQGEISAIHAASIVGDADEAQAAAIGHHVDARGAGIDRVLDQLLDDACRALYDLASGDAIDEVRRQLAYGHRGPRRVSGAQIAARDELTRFYRRLVEGIDAQQVAGENCLQHKVHHQGAKRMLVEPLNVDGAHGAAGGD